MCFRNVIEIVLARDWLALATTMSSMVAPQSLLPCCSKCSKFCRPVRGVLQTLRRSS